ncbi:MAG: hypothetical protein IPN10_16725 [Saprospiraceae bacterium]|nr:hypothetical protein [Saprospiraceae bacterium]
MDCRSYQRKNYIGKEVFTPDLKKEVKIKVEKHKIITFNVAGEDGKPLPNFEVKTNLSKKFQRTNTLYFVNEQIDSIYQVIVRKEGYKDKDIPDFYPGKENSINLTLIKKEKKPQGAFLTKLKTIFSNPAAIAISIVTVLLIAFGIWLVNAYLGKSDKSPNIQLTRQQIQTYVEGDSLLLHTLEDYKNMWQSQQKHYVQRKGKGFFGGQVEVDSSEWKKVWQPVFEKIELAIKKRNLIKVQDFAELKKQNYSRDQQSFKNALGKIDSTKYVELIRKLGDVSNLTLSDIADKFDEFLNSNNPEKQSIAENSKIGNEPNPSDINVNVPNKLRESNIKPNESKSESNSNDIIAEIIEYLKGNELEKSKLEEYKRLGRN